MNIKELFGEKLPQLQDETYQYSWDKMSKSVPQSTTCLRLENLMDHLHVYRQGFKPEWVAKFEQPYLKRKSIQIKNMKKFILPKEESERLEQQKETTTKNKRAFKSKLQKSAASLRSVQVIRQELLRPECCLSQSVS